MRRTRQLLVAVAIAEVVPLPRDSSTALSVLTSWDRLLREEVAARSIGGITRRVVFEPVILATSETLLAEVDDLCRRGAEDEHERHDHEQDPHGK